MKQHEDMNAVQFGLERTSNVRAFQMYRRFMEQDPRGDLCSASVFCLCRNVFLFFFFYRSGCFSHSCVFAWKRIGYRRSGQFRLCRKVTETILMFKKTRRQLKTLHESKGCFLLPIPILKLKWFQWLNLVLFNFLDIAQYSGGCTVFNSNSEIGDWKICKKLCIWENYSDFIKFDRLEILTILFIFGF